MEYLEQLYSVFPAWLNAVGLLAAAVSFILRAWLQVRQRDFPLYRHASFGVIVALVGFAVCYIWIQIHPTSTIEARGGMARICVFLLCLSLLNFNRAAIETVLLGRCYE